MANNAEYEDLDWEAFVDGIIRSRFKVSILKHQEEKQHECSNQIAKSLEKARAPAASTRPTNSTGLLGTVFGDNEEADTAPTMGLSKREVDKLKQQKGRLENLANEISKKVNALEAQMEEAHMKIRHIMKEPIFSTLEARHSLKTAVSSWAEMVDPLAFQCAATLGKLWLRTPTFFLSNSLLGRSGAVEYTTPVHETLPHKKFDPASMDPWAVYEEIDGLVETAAMHDEKAIEQLLVFLVDENLQHALRHHIIRMVADKAAYIARFDQDRITETGFKSAMVANWPKPHTSAPNHKVYQEIELAVTRLASEYNEDDKGGENVRTSAMAGGSGPLRRTTGRYASGQQVKQHPVDRQLKIVDANFADALSKDSLLHITPQVLQALLRIAEVGFERFHREELVLYGCPDIPEVRWQEPHWFLRRKAALRVCELAAEGHQLAAELIHAKLLRDAEHWVIRCLVVEEVCRMIGNMSPEQQIFRDFLDELARVLFTFPVVAKVPTRAFREQELANQGLSNTQRAAETSLTKELPSYTNETRTYIVQDLLRRTQSREGEEKRQVVDRIIRSIGGVKTSST